jgi:hypothetical protein
VAAFYFVPMGRVRAVNIFPSPRARGAFQPGAAHARACCAQALQDCAAPGARVVGAEPVAPAHELAAARPPRRSATKMAAPPPERGGGLKLAVLGTPAVGSLLIAAGSTPPAARCRFQWYRSGCVLFFAALPKHPLPLHTHRSKYRSQPRRALGLRAARPRLERAAGRSNARCAAGARAR